MMVKKQEQANKLSLNVKGTNSILEVFTDCSRREKKEVGVFLAGVAPGLGLKGRMVQKEAITPQENADSKRESVAVKCSQGREGSSVLCEKWTGKQPQASSYLGCHARSWILNRERVRGRELKSEQICRKISKLLWWHTPVIPAFEGGKKMVGLWPPLGYVVGYKLTKDLGRSLYKYIVNQTRCRSNVGISVIGN